MIYVIRSFLWYQWISETCRFSCDAGTGNGTSYEDAIPLNKPESIYLIFRSKERWRINIGCQYDENYIIDDLANNGLRIPQWNNLTSDDCRNRDEKQVTVTGNLTQAMQREYSTFNCIVEYRVGRLSIDLHNNLSAIPDLKVAPHNLTLSLSDVVEEGIRFNFSCESVGGKPSSSYTYRKFINYVKFSK